MKGDINFNFRINKKIGLFLLAGISLFATADFVSMIDVKSAGGVIVDGKTDEEIKELILETMPVGSVTFRMDAVNPSTIYGGTWTLLKQGVAIEIGDGTAQSGVSFGENTPSVPLVAHSHTMNHDHSSATTNTDTHNHGLRSGNNDAMDHYYKLSRNRGIPGINPSENQGGYTASTALMQNDSHNHTVDLPNYTGNTGYSGTSSPSIDVRSERISINVWKRTG